MRRNCPTCNPTTQTNNAPEGKDFYAVSITARPCPRPLVNVAIAGFEGQAYFDTGAKASIASVSLLKCFRRKGVPSKKVRMCIRLADGSAKTDTVRVYSAEVALKGRKVVADFIDLPGAAENSTLLGVDVLSALEVILIPCREIWGFLDQPALHYRYDARSRLRTDPVVLSINAKSSSVSPDKKRKRPMPAEEDVPRLVAQDVSRDHPSPESWDRHEVDKLWDACATSTTPTTAGNDVLQVQLDDDASELDIALVNVELRPDEMVGMSTKQAVQLGELLRSYADVFEAVGPPTRHAEHCIDTGDSPPVAVPPYRLSPAKKQALKLAVEEMLNQGVIVESESPWSTQAVLVPKKDGKLRCCIDYRRLNAITVPDQYPMPRIDDLLHTTRQASYMSTLDLKSGYWQIPIRKADQPKTAFSTPFGTYMFKVMPFGLRNAAATFQRLADRIKASLPGRRILAFLDDFAVLSESFEKHLEDLGQLLAKLRFFQLRLNREKCFFGRREIKYLGHLITPGGVLPDPDKISAILGMTRPNNERQLRSFLQTCSWFRRFVPNFAQTAEPLTRLTKKNVEWSWGPEQERAFGELKQQLVQPPILQQADPDKPYTLRTDASGFSIGAALLQGEKNDEHPIEYASRLLTKAEKNYSTTEREALAVVWAVDKFRSYIEGAEVTVATDHQPLRWLMTLKTPTGRLARWALLLQPFNLKVEYIPGKSNVLADLLSRLPNHEDAGDSDLPNTTELLLIDVCGVSIDLPQRSAAETRQAQLRDEQLAEIISAFESNDSRDAFTRYTARGYIMSGGVLYRFSPERGDEPQLVVPSQEREAILKAYHDEPTAGHYGAEKTADKIAEHYYWLGMYRHVAEYVKACVECQRYKASNLRPAGLLQTPVLQQRFEVLAIDLFGPLPEGKEGERWILIVEDVATRWVELFALAQATAQNCAVKLLDEVLLRFGMPRRIISDNGVQFISAVMQKLTFCLGISQNFTPLYHPEANPVERKNRDLKAQLAILVGDKHSEWPDKLPSIRFAMNSTKCSSTGFSAAYLNLARELRSPDRVSRDLRSIITSENFIAEITPKLFIVADALAAAKEVHEGRQDRNKVAADKHRQVHPEYKEGDLVLVNSHALSNAARGVTSKFHPRRDGPYVISKRIGPTSYEVKQQADEQRVAGVYHSSALTPYHAKGAHQPAPVNPIRQRGRPRKGTKAPTAPVAPPRKRGRPRKA